MLLTLGLCTELKAVEAMNLVWNIKKSTSISDRNVVSKKGTRRPYFFGLDCLAAQKTSQRCGFSDTPGSFVGPEKCRISSNDISYAVDSLSAVMP